MRMRFKGPFARADAICPMIPAAHFVSGVWRGGIPQDMGRSGRHSRTQPKSPDSRDAPGSAEDARLNHGSFNV